ncbi:MAG: TRAP transporter permease [Woeseiaceae bacterium]
MTSRFPTVIGFVALGIGVFHLLNVAGILLLSTMEVRIIHLSAMLVILYLGKPVTEGRDSSWLMDGLPALVALAIAVYLLGRWEAIAQSGGDTNALDLFAGVALLAVVLEATRRSIGNTLGLITVVFLVYPFVSPYLPGVMSGRGVSSDRVVNFLTTTTEGIYGIPLGVAATYIIMFSLYGAFLHQFGAGDFFFRVASKVTTGMRAASAKTAVIFSSVLGMISGSAAGNVAVTGSFTIPMMKKEGYEARQAAAIEAVVSTGGQILPPVMGSAAFIMAEIVGTPYVNVMKAALVPALLFFVSILCVVHLQAKKNGIAASRPANEVKDEPLLRTLWNGVPFIVPFALLIALMVRGYSPFKSCFYSMLVLVVAHAVWNREFGRSLFEKLAAAIKKGTTSAMPISIACAAAGIIAGNLAVSGLGIKISGIIISASGGIAIVALSLTMLTAILLGMGLPTTAAYLILATVVAPSLVELGVPLLTAHMFVFFYGCVSTITPPVALASYVAAGIAEADIGQVGWTAFRFGITCYILPFMFFFGPALMLGAPIGDIVLAVASGLLGVYAVAAAMVGYMSSLLLPVFRILALIAGVLLLLQGWVTDLVGIVIGATLLVVASRNSRERS